MHVRILLLGAGGLLGRAFAAEIHRRPIDSVAVDRTGCDVNDRDQVRAIFDQHRPAIAINCTAYTKVDLAEREPDLAMAVNATAVGHLAEACRAHGTRLIHFSTDFVFDGKSTRPYQPAGQTCALNVYGKTKLAGENLLRQIDPPGWMIARTSWLFGTTGPCFPKTILDRARSGQPLTIVNDQIGSPTYAPHLAAAILDLIDRNASGIRHVTNSGECSWFDFARAIVAEFGVSADIQPITTAHFREMRPQQAIRPAYSVLGDDELPTLLGRPMPRWQDAMTAYRAASVSPA